MYCDGWLSGLRPLTALFTIFTYVFHALPRSPSRWSEAAAKAVGVPRSRGQRHGRVKDSAPSDRGGNREKKQIVLYMEVRWNEVDLDKGLTCD